MTKDEWLLYINYYVYTILPKVHYKLERTPDIDKRISSNSTKEELRHSGIIICLPLCKS